MAPIATIFARWASGDVWATSVKFYVNWRSFDLGLSSFSLHGWALIWLGSGLSPFWALFALRITMLHFVSLCILNVFSMYSMNALLQMIEHQNLWKLLVVSPNSKFGVHIGSFYVIVGG